MAVSAMITMLLVGLGGPIAPSDTCREFARYIEGNPHRITMCQDASGQWGEVSSRRETVAGGVGLAAKFQQPQRQTSPAGTLPANFRGTVTYRGSISGVTLQQSIRVRTKGQMLPTGNYTGEVRIELNFDNGRVTGHTIPESGPLVAATLSGTRDGSTCTLHDAQAQSTWVGRCDASSFNGSAKAANIARRTPLKTGWEQTFKTSAVRVATAESLEAERDAALRQRESERLQAAQQANAEADHERQRLAAMPKAGPATTEALRRAVETDATNWAFNRIVPGSVKDVRVVTGTVGKPGRVRASYLYNESAEGWLEADIRAGQVACLAYWDMGGVCAPPRPLRSGRPGTDGGPVLPRDDYEDQRRRQDDWLRDRGL